MSCYENVYQTNIQPRPRILIYPNVIHRFMFGDKVLFSITLVVNRLVGKGNGIFDCIYEYL